MRLAPEADPSRHRRASAERTLRDRGAPEGSSPGCRNPGRAAPPALPCMNRRASPAKASESPASAFVMSVPWEQRSHQLLLISAGSRGRGGSGLTGEYLGSGRWAVGVVDGTVAAGSRSVWWLRPRSLRRPPGSRGCRRAERRFRCDRRDRERCVGARRPGRRSAPLPGTTRTGVGHRAPRGSPPRSPDRPRNAPTAPCTPVGGGRSRRASSAICVSSASMIANAALTCRRPTGGSG